MSADAGLTADAGLLVEQVGAQVPLRAQVCASQPTREIADVLVFAGAPANGNVVAWKRVPVADGKHCDYTWFEWVPSVRDDHTLAAEVLSHTLCCGRVHSELLILGVDVAKSTARLGLR